MAGATGRGSAGTLGMAVVVLVAAAARPAPSEPPAPAAASGAAAFVGAEACRDCHSDVHARWKGGRHSRMAQPATPASVKGDFGRGSVTLRGKRYGLRAASGAFFIRESYLQPEERERRVELTLGNRRVQHYLARLDDGRIVVLPPSWDVERREWFHNMDIVDLEESDDRSVQVWSTACFGCHVSGQEKVRDPASGVVTSRWTDHGTSCERCHGPGAEHVARYRGTAGSVPPASAATGIVRPTRLAASASSAVCAQCHSLRDVIASGYTAGAEYFDHYLPVLEYAQKRTADPAYWGDGRPRRFSNDALGLWQSQCYQKGGATCVTCHVDPHEPDVDKNPQLERADACGSCHAETARAAGAHSRHAPGQASCVDCHLPKTVVGVRARMRDHTIGVPVPENTARHGIPNACNECHRDRDPAWASRTLAQWWPSSPRRARLEDQAAVFARARSKDSAAVDGLVRLAQEPGAGPFTRANALGYLRLFPEDPRTPRALASALGAKEPVERAVAALGFVDLAPSDSARTELVRVLDDPRRAVRVTAALALAAQGIARLEGGKGELLRQAQAEYAVRASLNPDDAGALFDVGKFLLATEAWDAARGRLREAYALEPDRAGLRYHLGLALLRRMEVDEGKAMLAGVGAADPFHDQARRLLARLSMRQP